MRAGGENSSERVFTGYEWSEGSSEHIGRNLAMSVSTFSDDL
ncbi:hypothetical protein HMPREF3156_00554 [Neisseria sp. HMSC06F02]|nr:hypothetical protein HMPREF3156_00554 [Neisseria sp. HMSC06F02]